jgi:hypothetical protein
MLTQAEPLSRFLKLNMGSRLRGNDGFFTRTDSCSYSN